MLEWLETKFHEELDQHAALTYAGASRAPRMDVWYRAQQYHNAKELLDNNDGDLVALKQWAQAWHRFGERRRPRDPKHRSFVAVARRILSELEERDGA